MAAFAGGEIDVLVATTVIGWGRCGQRQPHGHRARRTFRPPSSTSCGPGRAGAHESSCVLLYAQPFPRTAGNGYGSSLNTPTVSKSPARTFICGAGEFVGSRQSGFPLRYADLEADADLVEAARLWPKRCSIPRRTPPVATCAAGSGRGRTCSRCDALAGSAASR